MDILSSSPWRNQISWRAKAKTLCRCIAPVTVAKRDAGFILWTFQLANTIEAVDFLVGGGVLCDVVCV